VEGMEQGRGGVWAKGEKGGVAAKARAGHAGKAKEGARRRALAHSPNSAPGGEAFRWWPQAPLLFISGCNSTNMGAQSLEMPQTRSASVAAARTARAQRRRGRALTRAAGTARGPPQPLFASDRGGPSILLHGTGRRVTRPSDPGGSDTGSTTDCGRGDEQSVRAIGSPGEADRCSSLI
jgi:hypothetical protein